MKAKLDMVAAPEDWRSVQEAVLKARALAKSFNALVQTCAIFFVWPMVAELKTLSDFTSLVRLFKPHDKRMRKGEMVVIEEFIEVRPRSHCVIMCWSCYLGKGGGGGGGWRTRGCAKKRW